MRLDVTVVPGPSAPGFAPAEVTVTGARACSVPDGGSGTGPHGDGHGGIAVAAALEARWPGTPFTVCGRPLNSLSPGVYPLVSGAVLVAGGTGADRGAGRGATVVLAVLSGPGSGAVFPLRRGVHRLGRGRNGITIADPALSRLHGTVTVGEESITLAPAHPSSGFSIRSAAASHPTASPERVHGPCLVAVGDVIACGQTCFTLRMPPLPETDARAPLVADRISSTGTAARDQGAAGPFAPIIVPRHQGSARGRLGMLAMAVLPLLFGVGFAWLTGSWMFLAFAGMSAVSVATPLLGGSRRRRQFRVDLASAAVRDAARRLAAFPDAAALILHQDCASPPPRPAATRDTPGGIPGSRPPGPGSPGSTSGVPSLRVGTAVQPALVRVAPDDPSFTPPALPSMPVTVCLPAAGLEIVGPAGLRRPLLNFLLMQLAASGIPVVVFGDPAALPLSARFLPLTVLAACAADVVAAVDELSEVGPDGPFPGLTVLLCLGPCTALDGLPWTGRPPVVIHCGPHPSQQAAAAVTLAIDGMTGHVSGLDFVPDGVPDAIFDRFARSAGLRASAAGKAVGLAPSTMPPPERSNGPAIVHDWQTNRGGPLAAIRLGRAADGDELFDFGRDGPHLLIAGTTGSGKSEFLRTLVGGLALSHPPSELSFIFFDFKGGAGLGPLQKLPHTSCLITDLAGHGMQRTLASLRTEILRREALLGRVEAADLDDYRRRAADAVRAPCAQAMQTLAHLVVVVDEFRVLVDQFPDSMAELMRLASVGRSLGIHLVLATQRPQGAVNADIRANVTTSICLRVQSALDSQDVIGTAGAAAIPVAKPGRAFISRPGGPPSAFHTATLRLGAETASAAEATVYPTLELLSARSRLGHPGVEGAGAPQPERPLPASDIDSVAGLLMSAWQLWMDDGGEAAAPHVVAPQLPVTVDVQAMELDATEADGGRVLDELPHGGDDPAGALAAAASPDGRVPGSAGDAATATKPRALVLGLLDVPESQALRPLRWAPAIHSHLAFIGPPASGAAETLVTVATRLSVPEVGVPPRGAARGSEECWLYLLDGDGSLRGVHGDRVGSHIAAGEVRSAARLLRRLAEIAASGAPPPPDADGRGVLVLCISDWGYWMSALRRSPWPWAEDVLSDLVRRSDARVVIMAAGERELFTAPFMASIPNRLFFPQGATSESRLLWPRFPQFQAVKGRAAAFGPINAAAVGAAGTANDAGTTPHVAQLGLLPDRSEVEGGPITAGAPERGPAPRFWSPTNERVSAAPPLLLSPLPRHLPLAVARDIAAHHGGHAPAHSQDVRTGPRRLLLGVGGDGMDPVFATVARGLLVPVLGGPASGKTACLTALAALNENGGATFVDDLASLQPDEVDALVRVLEDGGTVVAAMANHATTLARLPLGLGVRGLEQGIIVAPRRPQDGELFGLRLDTSGAEPPGRAVFVDRGRLDWFQFPDPGPSPSEETWSNPVVPPTAPAGRHRFAA